MTDLEKLVSCGILKENEEIYFDYKEHHFPGRIRENGKYIETILGKFNSPSPAAGTLLALIDDGELKRLKDGEVICNG